MAIHVGTSGWHYRHWSGTFYPEGTRPADFLSLYIRRFKTVEINNSFYRLPSEKTLIDWHAATPKNFLFAVKASRFITHNKKLKDAKNSFQLFFQRVQVLGKKLGPILFQLPPAWNYNGERLAEFLSTLPSGPQYVFEFRNPTWYHEKAYDLLEQHRAAICRYDWQGRETPNLPISQLVYVRFHGPEPGYGGSYGKTRLETWAKRLDDWSRQGRAVFAYFNNDAGGWAPRNALTLLDCLKRVRNPDSGSQKG